MQNILLEEQVRKVASLKGIEVYQIKTGKFKTNSINIFFHDDLSRERATGNAVVPAVLRRGCKRFPTFRDVALYLEELYGASFDCGVTKKGERQIIQFYIDYIADRYAGIGSNLFEKAFGLLHDIIAEPVLENGVFKTDYVEQEKDNIKKLIESRVNDKVQYAVDRCLEAMCENEPFGIYDYGSVDDLKDIDSRKLYTHYKKLVGTYPMEVYVTGMVEEDSIVKMLDMLSHLRSAAVNIPESELQIKKVKGPSPDSFSMDVKEVKNVTQKMSVNQGKLSMGFRTNIPPDSNSYFALLVYNGILGGGIHSKLFQNVREKASLAYYAFSRLEKFKGLMVISSGIEVQNKGRTSEIILRQIDEIKAGNISDYEFESTLKTIETGIKSLKDNQLQMVDYYLSQSIAGTEVDLDTLIEEVKKVTRQEIIDVAKKIKLDTVYFLTAGENGGEKESIQHEN